MNLVQILNTFAGMNISWSNRTLEIITAVACGVLLIFVLHVLYLIIRIAGGR